MAAKILIVDDDLDTLNLIELILKIAGYTVVKANSGEECLRLAREQRPNLIILDIMMPSLSGLDVLKQLSKKYGRPPVILFSAKNQITDVVEGMEAGAYKYLVKPASRDQLLKTVKAALEEAADRQTNQDDWGENW